MTEAIGHVVPDTTALEPRRNGGTAATRVVIDSSHGARLEQRLVTYAPGRSPERTLEGAHAVLYIVEGHGRLHLNGETHELEPETGVFVAAGETFAVENDGPGSLEVVEVGVPQESAPAENRRVLVHYRDRPDESASSDRDFRCLVNEDAGIAEVTQFVGVIQPGRAPMHSHEYDEVLYVVEGEGVVHWDDGRAIAVRRGSCIHFPVLKLHSLENTLATPMRVMGVLHPQLSPASPKLLLMDEPSMGLAPILVERSFDIISQVHEAGVAVLVVEQNANFSLSIADRGYVLSTGRVVLSDRAEALLGNEELRKAYLGR